ncbi:putative uncharacterized protein [Prevotella sp. CAG:1092]|nr:putative uncharacterized protein [Prevotella sp. CAG:1092]
MSTLVDEVYKNEKAIVTTFGTVGSATGIVDAEGNISYQKKADAHYIAPANSVHEATVLLDNSLNGVKTTADQNKTDIEGLASSIGIEKETEGTYSYPDNIGSNYFEDATSVIQAMTALDNEIYNVNGKARKIATAAGVINAQDVIGYQKETGVLYIGDAVSVHDATVKLDFKLKETTDTSDKNFRNIEYLANVAGAVKNVEGVYIYQSNDNTKYIAGAHSVHEATVLLDNELSKQDDTDSDIAKAIGLTKTGTKYVYKANTYSNYIGFVNSVDEATIALDSQIKNNENLIYGILNVLPDYDERFNIINKVISKFPSIEYVDLGLPSGTLWLTCNLGATTPTDIGHYYMWGSLSPNDKTICSWSNTPFNDGQTSKNDTVFNTATAGTRNIILYQNRLNEAFDVIYHRTHGIAKLPTEEQINELISDTNTTRDWVTNYQGITVKGFTFTSKRNNNVLFIPAGGYRDADTIKTKELGKAMFVMSSNINSEHKIITLKGYNSGLTNGVSYKPKNVTLDSNQAIPLRGVIV